MKRCGTEKKTAAQMLVKACDIDEALTELKKGMQGTIADYIIASMSETAIMDVFPYSSDKVQAPKIEKTIFDDEQDPLFDKVKELIIQAKLCTPSLIQRNFEIGYNRANKIISDLEKAGIVGEFIGASPRTVIDQV